MWKPHSFRGPPTTQGEARPAANVNDLGNKGKRERGGSRRVEMKARVDIIGVRRWHSKEEVIETSLGDFVMTLQLGPQ